MGYPTCQSSYGNMWQEINKILTSGNPAWKMRVEDYRMSISQRLCEVRDREFGGKQKLMAIAWDNINQSTLSRWLNGSRIPDPTWYGFLSDKLRLSVIEIHELCMEGKTGKLAISSARKQPVLA